MGTFSFEFFSEVDIILEGVFSSGWVGNIAGVSDTGFGNGPCFITYGMNAGAKGFYPVEGIEDAENIDTTFGGTLNKIDIDIIGIGRVAHPVATAEEHLQKHVGHGFTQLIEALPRAFV